MYLTLLLLALFPCVQNVENLNKILLRDIKVLTFRRGLTANGRHSRLNSQIHCVGGSAGCTSFAPEVIKCYNIGAKEESDAQWDCKADIDRAYQFGNIEIICEGYESESDPYILEDSCGIEYTLHFSNFGRQKYGFNQVYYTNGYRLNQPQKSQSLDCPKPENGSCGLAFVVITSIIGFFLYIVLAAAYQIGYYVFGLLISSQDHVTLKGKVMAEDKNPPIELPRTKEAADDPIVNIGEHLSSGEMMETKVQPEGDIQ